MCRGAVGGMVLLLAWTVYVSCVLYLVRVTGWLGFGCFSGVCAPHNFSETWELSSDPLFSEEVQLYFRGKKMNAEGTKKSEDYCFVQKYSFQSRFEF